ncbi:hypothetical protein NB700_001842 [Xanthomonas sacchari]|uniref:Uncharacterized protein n=1 Tax=Xanthomonas sacchari TaxID=56458 RepID=A0ABT3DUW3_9XANT|nr:hypothetical protein [Xanthomonas sacchari]
MMWEDPGASITDDFATQGSARRRRASTPLGTVHAGSLCTCRSRWCSGQQFEVAFVQLHQGGIVEQRRLEVRHSATIGWRYSYVAPTCHHAVGPVRRSRVPKNASLDRQFDHILEPDLAPIPDLRVHRYQDGLRRAVDLVNPRAQFAWNVASQIELGQHQTPGGDFCRLLGSFLGIPVAAGPRRADWKEQHPQAGPPGDQYQQPRDQGHQTLSVPGRTLKLTSRTGYPFTSAIDTCSDSGSASQQSAWHCMCTSA